MKPKREHVEDLVAILQRRSPERLTRLVERGLVTASWAELSAIVDEVLADELQDRGMGYGGVLNEYGEHVDDLISTFNAMRLEREPPSADGEPPERRAR